MKIDIEIINGHVIDPSRSINRIESIGIVGNKIVNIQQQPYIADRVIDAAGCYVFPGLIDFHTHIFQSGGMTPVKPDLMLAMGVTATVDAGTSGCANYDAFYKTDIVNSHLRIRSQLNVSSGGLADENIPENLDPELYNINGIYKAFEKYGSNLLGLKVRMGRSMVHDIEPLVKTMKIANDIGNISVCVHPTDSPCLYSEIVDMLRKDDILCHMYHGRGSTILDDSGNIHSEVIEARKRGVIFDMANGRGNFCHRVAITSIDKGFWPDIISSDIGIDKMYLSLYARSLPFIMSKLYSMGMDLQSIVKATTLTPAKAMGMERSIGTLAPGAYADVALFTMIKKKVHYLDYFNEMYIGDDLLIPQLTISDGEPVFAQGEFNV